MKAMIASHLYHPSVVLPMVSLMQLLVTHDFNLGQVGFAVAARGARVAVRRSRALVGGLHGLQHAAP